MATWKKILTSGSAIVVDTIKNPSSTVAGTQLTGSFTGSFTGDGSNLTGTGFNIDELSNSLTKDTIATGDLFAVADINDSNEEKKITFANVRDGMFEDVSGDATIAAGGALTIADNAVSLAKLAGISRGHIIIGDASGDPAALDANDDGKILVGDGSDINSVAISGDVSLANDGAVTIQPNAVEGSMLNSNVAGSGLDYGSNQLSVDVSDFLSNGVDNRIVTATGTDAMNAEANLTFDGSTLNVTGDAVVSGDLTVNGDLTTIATTNTLVEDQLMFLGTGSAETPKDVGIIAQSGSTDKQGSAFYHDIDVVAKTNPNGGRWSVGKSVNNNATAITPLQFVTTVKTDTVNPDTTSGSYGAGEMHVNTTSGEIWIRFE